MGGLHYNDKDSAWDVRVGVSAARWHTDRARTFAPFGHAVMGAVGNTGANDTPSARGWGGSA